jgi:hypothetical protein
MKLEKYVSDFSKKTISFKKVTGLREFSIEKWRLIVYYVNVQNAEGIFPAK